VDRQLDGPADAVKPNDDMPVTQGLIGLALSRELGKVAEMTWCCPVSSQHESFIGVRPTLPGHLGAV